MRTDKHRNHPSLRGMGKGSMAVSGLSVPYRVMFLGDSLTLGLNATAQGGFRQPTSDDMTIDGRTFTAVGSQVDGSFANNRHEGHSGWTSAQLLGGLARWLDDASPIDIVHLMIGTNDLATSVTQATLFNQISALLDLIHGWRIKTWINVSALPPNGNSPLNTLISTFNAALPGFLATYSNTLGRRVHASVAGSTCSMANVVAGGDNTHPVTAGYNQMEVQIRADFNAIMNVWV